MTCQTLKRQGTVRALQEQYAGRVKIIMIDIATASGAPYAAKYRVLGTPAWVLFDGRGRVRDQFVGWPGTAAVATKFDQVLAAP